MKHVSEMSFEMMLEHFRAMIAEGITAPRTHAFTSKESGCGILVRLADEKENYRSWVINFQDTQQTPFMCMSGCRIKVNEQEVVLARDSRAIFHTPADLQNFKIEILPPLQP